MVPTAVPGVDARSLDPRSTWADPVAYDKQATKLADMFVANFAKFESYVDEFGRASVPKAKTPA